MKTKKIEKSKNNYGVILVVSVLIAVSIFAGVIQIGKAQVVKSDVAELTDLALTLNNADAFIAGIAYLMGDRASEAVFGASGDNLLSSFTNEAMKTEGITIDGPAYFTATTTPSVATKYTVSTDLSLVATTTANGSDSTKWLVAYYTNTGADKIVDWVGIDQSTANVSLTASYQVGTSTWVGGVEGGSLTATTSVGVIASTTIAATFTTDTLTNLIDVENDTSTSAGLAEDATKFLLKNGDVLFVTWNPYTATSPADFTAAGGFTGVGKLFISLFARDN